MESILWMAMDKKEVTEQIDDIIEYLDKTVHPVVSPDNWYVYSELYDLIEQFRITLKQKSLID